MPRPAIGSIVRTRTKLGISYGLRFAYGEDERVYHHFGGSWEGWDEERVERERTYVMEQVRRGEYVPEKPAARAPRLSAKQTFQVVASVWLHRKELELAPKGGKRSKTYRDLEWRLQTAMDHFGSYPVDQIDADVIDGFVVTKLEDRRAIDDARAAAHPLMETYTTNGGKRHQRRRRGLSNDSINKVLKGVRMVLKDAERKGLIERNPVDDETFLRVERPSRSFLEPVQVAALLEAADLVEREHRGLGWADVKAIRGSDKPNLTLARKYEVSDTLIRKVRRGDLWKTPSDGRRDRNDIPRKPIIAMLALAGLRISELCGLDGEHMDFAHGRIKVPRGKTVASERVEPMAPALREILLAHRADYAYGPKDPVFATRTGRRNTPDNIRNRVLAPVRTRANELLLERGHPTIGHLTPHTLRRTFASMLAELGVNPRRAMYLLGHVDPTLTMRVYQHVLDVGSGGLEVLESLVGGTVDEVLSILNGRADKPMKSQEAVKKPSSRVSVGRLEGSKTSN